MIQDPRSSFGGRIAMNPQRQTFSFPLVKPPEIIICFNELGIHITEEDITYPEKNKEQVRRILENCAEICTGISKEEMNQPAFAGLPFLNFPELHDESIPQINSLRACSRMMEICGIQDFGIKDFMNPSAKRFRRQLSGIINYAKFREERFLYYNDLHQTKDQLNLSLEKEKQRNELLNRQLSGLRENASKEEESIMRVESECKEIVSKIENINNFQAQMREESVHLKNLFNEFKEENNTRALHLEELQSLQRKLSSQIVNSPERFKKQSTDANLSLAAEQRDVKLADKKVKENTLWIAGLDETQAEVELSLAAVHELSVEVDNQKDVICQLDNIRQAAGNRRKVLNELDQNINQLSRQCIRSEEKFQNIRKQVSKRGTDSLQHNDEIQNQLMEAENFKSQLSLRTEKAEAEAYRQEHESESENALFKQEQKSMLTSYKKLESVVATYLQSLRKSLDGEEMPMNAI